MNGLGVLAVLVVGSAAGCGRMHFDPLDDGGPGSAGRDATLVDGPGGDGPGAALCGDGIAQQPEQCDDGGPTAACTATCTLVIQPGGGTCAAPAPLVLARTPGGHGAIAMGDTSLASNGAQVACTPANTLDMTYVVTLAAPAMLAVTLAPTTAWNPALALRDGALACNQATTYCCVDAGGASQPESSVCAVPAGPVMIVVDASAGNQSGPFVLTVSAP